MDANACIVDERLSGKKNYRRWSVVMKTYLRGQALWDTVNLDGDRDPSETRNAKALHTILISCGTKPFSVIENISSAREAWSTLLAKYGPGDEVTETESESSSGEEETETDGNSYGHYMELFRAVRQGNLDKTREELVKYPEAINARAPRSKMNLLHVAIREGHLHIVRELVGLMSDEAMEMAEENALTPLFLAIEVGRLDIAKCLIERHSELATLSSFGPDYIPVWYAVDICRKTMVPYLYSKTPIKDMILQGNLVPCARLLSESISVGHYDIVLEMLAIEPELGITIMGEESSPLWELADSKLLANEPSLAFWRRWIYDCIHISTRTISKESQRDGEDVKVDMDPQSSHIPAPLEENQRDNKDIGYLSIARKLCLDLLRKMVSIPIKLVDIKGLYELKKAHLQIREILRIVCEVIEKTSDPRKLEKAGIDDAMSRAALVGNLEFIIGFAKANPELVWTLSTSRRVIESGIKYRQPKVFNLIYSLPNKVALVSGCTKNESTMLHKVAIIASPPLLNRIPGAALQMQRELQWFEEIKAIATPDVNKITATDHPYSATDETEELEPREIFTRSHKDLVIAGERWMKDTASSCSVVGALIITVTFAAAFTFPGGNDQNHGFPVFRLEKLFRVFMMLNTVALSASTTSVLVFLGILTSRYAEDDFLTSLPRKLIIGLLSLFLSIATMLTAFCIGLSIMFHEKFWIVFPSAVLVSVPVALFAMFQFPLLVDVFKSTYGPSIFDKNMKRWI